MESESDSPFHNQHTGQERGSPGRGSGWEMEFRDCGAILGRGLLLTTERCIEGM